MTTSARPRLADRAALRRGAVAALLLATAAAYAPSLPGAFTLDDPGAIAQNPALQDPAGLVARLPASFVGRGRAVTDLTFAVGRALLGPAPAPTRAVNVAIHLLMALVALGLCLEVLGRAGLHRPWLALAAAALWTLHPLCSGAVAYAAQRAESLSALFAAAAVLVALRAGRSTRPLLGGLLAAALVLLSLGAKGVGVVAFGGLALVLAAFPPGGRPDGPALWRRTLPLLLPALAFGLGLLSHVRGKADVGFSMGDLPALDAWRSQGRVVATYLRLALWPAGQSADHGLAASASLDSAALAGWAVVLGLLLASLAALGPRRDPAVRVAGFGGLWFLLWLAPTSALPIADLVAEHRAYLALLGPALAAAALGDLLVRRLAPTPRAAVAAGAALALLACGALGVALARRAALWGDTEALWRDAARVNPAFFRPWSNLAKALQARGRGDEAVLAWREAVARWPASQERAALREVERLRDLAAAGRAGEAAAALETLPANVVPAGPVYAAMGRLWVDLGAPRTAELLLSQAAVIGDYPAAVLAALAQAFAAEGRLQDAVTVAEAALRRSDDLPTRLELARLLAQAGRREEACRLLGGDAGPERLAEAEALGCPPGRRP